MAELVMLSAVPIKTERVFYFILPGAAVAGAIIAFPFSFLSQSNLLIGICLLPFVVHFRAGKRFNYSFFLLMVFFAAVSFTYGIRMFYFFTLIFYLFWSAELFIGRINALTVFLLGFMSPFFFQASVILGFPIRLQLSQLAGILLKAAGLNIQIEGNTMVLDGAAFSVDEPCMGLSTLAISMLMGVFILTQHSRVAGKSLRLIYTFLFFATCFVLNLVDNLFRIVVLVLFEILPENPMHEIIGICCLVVYVLIPVYILSRWMIGKFGVEPKDREDNLTGRVVRKLFVMVCSIAVLLVGIRVDWIKTQPVVTHASVSLAGFKNTEIGDGVTKMSNEAMLVYVKLIPEFFTAEHTPLLCWKGSGYTFKSIEKKQIAGREIYFGQLIKPGERLYTAWWYSNGTVQTISQLDWRLRMLKGEARFCLVNVTTNDEIKLIENIKMISEQHLLKITN